MSWWWSCKPIIHHYFLWPCSKGSGNLCWLLIRVATCYCYSTARRMPEIASPNKFPPCPLLLIFFSCVYYTHFWLFWPTTFSYFIATQTQGTSFNILHILNRAWQSFSLAKCRLSWLMSWVIWSVTMECGWQLQIFSLLGHILYLACLALPMLLLSDNLKFRL